MILGGSPQRTGMHWMDMGEKGSTAHHRHSIFAEVFSANLHAFEAHNWACCKILLCSQIPRCCRKQQGHLTENELWQGMAWPLGGTHCPGHCRGAGSCLPGFVWAIVECNVSKPSMGSLWGACSTLGGSSESGRHYWSHFCSTCHWPEHVVSGPARV